MHELVFNEITNAGMLVMYVASYIVNLTRDNSGSGFYIRRNFLQCKIVVMFVYNELYV